MPPRLALALAAALVSLVLSAPVPVLDEESYLDIGAMLDPFRPYDWWRPWPPWGAAREEDAFVYAHPPFFLEWVSLWVCLAGLTEHPERAATLLWPVKLAAGLPWAALAGWSVGRLAERWTREPLLTGLLWLSTPVAFLSLQRGLMPDLMAAALGFFGIVAHSEARAAGLGPVRARWAILGGLSIGAAILTKYPWALLTLPLLWRDLRERGGDRRFWMALGFLCCSVELGLWATYGRLHLYEVLNRADEIPRGPFWSRQLGLLVRLPLALLPLPLFARPGTWPVAIAVATITLLLGAPSGTEPLDLAAAGLIAALGALSSHALSVGMTKPGSEDRFFAGAALIVILGVALAHNFAAPRYLAALVPFGALFLVRTFATSHKGLLWATVALQLCMSGALSLGEHRFFGAADAAALAVARAHPSPGWYTGEWSFRWRMRLQGWQFWDGVQELPPGAVLAVPENSSPAALPPGLQPGPAIAIGRGGGRVVDAPAGTGLYSEATGLLPFGWRPGPLEQVTLWTRPESHE